MDGAVAATRLVEPNISHFVRVESELLSDLFNNYERAVYLQDSPRTAFAGPHAGARVIEVLVMALKLLQSRGTDTLLPAPLTRGTPRQGHIMAMNEMDITDETDGLTTTRRGYPPMQPGPQRKLSCAGKSGPGPSPGHIRPLNRAWLQSVNGHSLLPSRHRR